MELTAQRIDDMRRALMEKAADCIVTFPNNAHICMLAASYLDMVKAVIASKED